MTPPIPTLDLTRDDILDEIDRVAKLRRGMSGADLLRIYRDGSLKDPGEVADVLILADLLDSNDDPEKIQPSDR
jgi:hypothetical protein